MKVTISEVADVRDAVMASGLSLWLESMGVSVEAPPMPMSMAIQPVPRPAGPEQTQIRRKGAEPGEENQGPAKRNASAAPAKPVKSFEEFQARKEAKFEKVKKAKAKKPAVEVGEVRLTIRERIKQMLLTGPKSSREVVAELAKQGIQSDTGLAGQHMYLMTRDGITVRNEETNTWSLVA